MILSSSKKSENVPGISPPETFVFAVHSSSLNAPAMRLNPFLEGLDLPPKPDADSLSIIRSEIVFTRDTSSVRQYFQRSGHGKIDDVRAESARAQGQRRHKPPVVAVKIEFVIYASQVLFLQAGRKIDPALLIVSIRRPSSRLHKPIAEHQQQSQGNDAAHRRKDNVDFNRRNHIQTYLRNWPRVNFAL